MKLANQRKVANKSNNVVLLMIDMQEKLLKNIVHNEEIIWNIKKLINACKILDIRTIYSEQNPKKLGSTIYELANMIDEYPYEKMTFSCFDDDLFKNKLNQADIKNILICGIESHICVQQSALDLIEAGYNVFIAADSIGSRKLLDHDFAIKRMRKEGVKVSTTESIIFELCKTADRPEFKAISTIIKECI